MKKNQRMQKAKNVSAQKGGGDRTEHQLLYTGPRLPPPLSLAKKELQVRRFIQNGAVSSAGFSLAMGHDQFLVVMNNLGNAIPYVDSWRIKALKFWVISDGAASTAVTVTPTGTDLTSNMRNDRESIWECTSRSSAEPATMTIRMSKSQPLGSWHFTNTTNVGGVLFITNIQTNGMATQTRVTMDVVFETITNYAGLPLGYTVNTTTLVAGTVGGRNVQSGFNLIGVNNLG